MLRSWLAGAWSFGEGLPAGVEDLPDVHPGELLPERRPRREPAIRNDLQHRSQRQPVVCRQEMDRRPQHRRCPNNAALLEQPGELEWIEAVQS
jgi:hypothetical protein